MKYAVFGFSMKNLGEDGQSLATALVFPHVDMYVDRDRLNQVRLKEPHLLIMNSWFARKPYDAVPSSSLAPIYFGYCIGHHKELLNESWISEWKRRAPIGCRDRQSVEDLRGLGIDAHWTGCLTMWMGRFFRPAKREGVLFIDVPEPIERFIPEAIRKRARRLTNGTGDRGGSQLKRFLEIAQVLDAIRSAELVVTRRLHAALPCVSFGTPVTVYLEDIPKNRRRFSGPDEFLPIVLHNGDSPIDGVSWKDPVAPSVPAEIEERFQALCETLGCSVAPRWNSVSEFAATLPDVRREPRGLFDRLKPGARLPF